MKLLLKKGVDWNGKYGFEDAGRLSKSKRVGKVVVYLSEIGEGEYFVQLWTMKRTKETKALMDKMIANGDARLAETPRSF